MYSRDESISESNLRASEMAEPEYMEPKPEEFDLASSDPGTSKDVAEDASYQDAIAFFNEPRWRKISLGLKRIDLLLELLGNPQDTFKVIHVAGTNGKGSVCAYLDSILRASGFKCGLFTSPYIEKFEERIRVDGENISSCDLVCVASRIKQCAQVVEEKTGEHPSEFELMCAAAFLHFANEGCEVVVCEVGLGGRLDATNVVEPTLCVITRVGLDHTDVLGDTIEDIAREKAGIIKRGVPVVSWPQETGAMKVIESTCEKLGCRLHVPNFCEVSESHAFIDEGVRAFKYKGEEYTLGMLATYQVQNAVMAIDCAHALRSRAGLHIPDKAIYKGIASAFWPGRFEILGHSPLFIVDGAHNPQGAASLAETLMSPDLGVHKKVSFICGMLADKDCEGALERIMPLAKKFYTYTPNNPRAIASAKLADIAKSVSSCAGFAVEIESFDSTNDAVAQTLRKEGSESIIVAFGTLYSIADVKRSYFASSASFGEMTP